MVLYTIHLQTQEQRMRLILQHQQRVLVQPRNPLDPYDEMVQRPGVVSTGSNQATPQLQLASPGIPQGIRLRPAAPQTDQQVSGLISCFF